MNDKELVRIARDFRDGILGPRSSRAMCFAVCGPLHGLLALYGVEATIEDGEFGDWNHFWLRLPDGRVLDPTADQFNDQLEHPLPPVYLGPAAMVHCSADR